MDKKSWIAGAAALVVVAPGLALALGTEAVRTYYTANSCDGGVGCVKRIGADGGVPIVDGLDDPEGIAVDTIEGRLYVADSNAHTITRYNLDGTGGTVVVNSSTGLFGVAIDEQDRKLYWTAEGTGANGTVEWKHLDSGATGTVMSGLAYPQGLALDVKERHVYVADFSNNRIRRADMDGSNVKDIVTSTPEPTDIALDLDEDKLYWTERTTSSSGKIRRCNFDGSNVEDVVSSAGTTIAGITVDAAGHEVCWMDVGPTPSKMYCAPNIPGATKTEVLTTTGGLGILRVRSGKRSAGGGF